MSRISPAVCLFACLAATQSVTRASSLYGISYWDEGSTQGGQSGGVGFLQDLPKTSDSECLSLTDGQGTYSTLSASIADGALHAYSSVVVPAGPPGYAAATNGVDEYFWDTFYFSQAGQVQITVTFDGTVSSSVTPGLDLPVDRLQVFEGANEVCAPGSLCADSNYLALTPTMGPDQTYTFVLNVSAGALSLGEWLSVRNGIGNNGDCPPLPGSGGMYESCSQTIDDSDTAFFSVTPVTTGLTFTTASGLTYSDVPEPSPMLLVGTALVTLSRLNRRRKTIG